MDGSGTMFGEFDAALGLKSLVVSYPKDQPLDYGQLVALVARAIPADEPLVVLGESFSGPIAIALAARHAATVKAVVLVCTFAKLKPRYAPRWFHRLLAMLPFWKLPVAWGARGLLGRFDSTALRAKLVACIAGVTPAVWRSRMFSVLEVDVTSELAGLGMPILYLRGTEDRVVPAAAAALIARTNARTRVVDVVGPHALLQTVPGPCALAVRTFLQQSGAGLG
ncbi:MAG TPA: alpha/beta hydrolase [Steroidobacteraceae bacterium]|nr:alpha/beta hydrolase [Steroidobacteraceae bacterium]